MSSGLKSEILSLPATAPYSVWMTPREGFPMGIPSTTYKALLFPTIDLEPRMMTRVAPPTPEELFWMLTPATLPFKLFMKLASLATVSSELLTVCTL